MASARSSAPMIPASSSSEAPVNRSPAPAASVGEAQQHPAAGRDVQRLPGAEPAGRARRTHRGPAAPSRASPAPAARPSPRPAVRPRPGAAPPPTAPQPPAPRPAPRRSAATPPATRPGPPHPAAPSRPDPGTTRDRPPDPAAPHPLSAAASHASHRSGSAIGSVPGGTGRHPSASSMGLPATSHPQLGSGCTAPGACPPRAGVSPGPPSEGADPRGMHHHPFGRMIVTLPIEHDSEKNALLQACWPDNS